MIGVLGEGDARLNRALLLLEKRVNEKSSCHGALVRGVHGKSAARIRTDDHGGEDYGQTTPLGCARNLPLFQPTVVTPWRSMLSAQQCKNHFSGLSSYICILHLIGSNLIYDGNGMWI